MKKQTKFIITSMRRDVVARQREEDEVYALACEQLGLTIGSAEEVRVWDYVYNGGTLTGLSNRLKKIGRQDL